MIVSKSNWEDAKKYFHHTYIKCSETGDEVFFVDEVTPEWMILSDSNGEKAGIKLDTPYELSYVIPKKTVFQNGEYAVQLSRIPARMWKKGMNKQNTTFHKLNNGADWVNTDISIGLIEGFVKKPGYMSFADAQREFQAGTISSAAITPRIAMSKAGNVFIDSVLVGKYKDDKKVLICSKIFSPELSKHFPKLTMKEI